MSIYESISKITKQLMLKEPFYGLFLIGMNKAIRKDVPTAGVSKHGINIQLSINEEYWNSLASDNVRLALLKHELLHVVFFHLEMRDSFHDRHIFNLAADMEVNQYVDQSALDNSWITIRTWPELNLEPFKGTKYYYDAIVKALQNNTSKGLSNQYRAMISGECSMHGTWDEFEGLSEAEKQLIRKQIEYQMKDIVENGLKGRGHVPGELKTTIDGLFEITPPVFDWKSYLRRFVGQSTKIYTRKTRRKLSKRFAGNPALKIKTKNHVLVAVDTSGSVSDQELKEFFNEIHHMHKAGVFITVAQCDADIHDVSEYKGKFDGRIHGRGGTNFQPVIDYYDQHKGKYSTLIFLTDTYAPCPTKPKGSMMWVVSSGGAALNTLTDWPGYKIKIPAQNGN